MELSQNVWGSGKLVKVLQDNGVAVMPTDTIYGIVGKALFLSTVLRIYEIKKRAPEKPCIILIGDIKDLEKFSIVLSEEQKNKFEELSLGQPTSIILSCSNDSLSYLHRGTMTLAFRLPATKELRALLLETGPLVAPSANPEGLAPAKSINEAQNYFGNSVDPVRGREGSQRPSTSNGVDLYIDGGEIAGKASKIIRLNDDGSVVVIRE